ncbi:protein BRANCHLESS TRICHOME-like [Phragmites australis]|uniref:protein BRANCHLESS TRICHOME-like n=1 Tax=Phragmites australis TaxID=29695 RepID=UPI002D7669BF|nr:protein BRANCHLESS TRICHOME-like [Phragmites australis]
MASVQQVEANHGAGSHCSPPWKLYRNPLYSPQDDHSPSVPSFSRSSCQGRKDLEPHMIVVFDDGGGEEVELDQGYGAMSSELELCVARIRELRADLEFERRMRRKAEALNEALAAELSEERRRGEAAEAECRALREEAGATRAEAERAMEEIKEERRMMRVAELWREERVQMKLANARAAMEEKLRDIDDAVAELHATAASCNKSSRSRSPNASKSNSTSQHGEQSPSRSQQGQLHRREAGGSKNPHIRRGIKGSVEFPRAVRMRPREERVDLVTNLECQRAQLRVLMRHRSPAAGMGLIGAAENLVV